MEPRPRNTPAAPDGIQVFHGPAEIHAKRVGEQLLMKAVASGRTVLTFWMPIESGVSFAKNLLTVAGYEIEDEDEDEL